MQTLFFIFGKTPDLSRAEVFAVLRTLGVKSTVVLSGAQFLILTIPKTVDPSALQFQLGGTTKIGEIVMKLPSGGTREDQLRASLTPAFLASLLPRTEQRVTFGFSMYAHDGRTPLRLYQKLYRHGLTLKNALKEEGFSPKFVSLRGTELSSVAVTKEKMLDRGVELCLFLSENETHVGRTRAVQDFKAYSARDYGRPGRDDVSGMLPPKLAQMLVNLAGVPRDATLLDPFCGSGTVLMEAARLGYQRLIGVDISERAIEDARANLQWFENASHTEANVKLYQHDAARLNALFKPASIDAVVTEPYLGPPLRGNEPPEKLRKTLAELQRLYQQWLTSMHTVLRAHGRLVMVIPHFRVRGTLCSMSLKFSGFRLDRLDGATLSHGGLIYQRPDQHVLREILVATKR